MEDFGLQDSWLAAEQLLTPGWGTFPFFEDVQESEFRIDWIQLSQEVGCSTRRSTPSARAASSRAAT